MVMRIDEVISGVKKPARPKKAVKDVSQLAGLKTAEQLAKEKPKKKKSKD